MAKPKKRKIDSSLKDAVEDLFKEVWTRAYNQGKRDAFQQSMAVAKKGPKTKLGGITSRRLTHAVFVDDESDTGTI